MKLATKTFSAALFLTFMVASCSHKSSDNGVAGETYLRIAPPTFEEDASVQADYDRLAQVPSKPGLDPRFVSGTQLAEWDHEVIDDQVLEDLMSYHLVTDVNHATSSYSYSLKAHDFLTNQTFKSPSWCAHMATHCALDGPAGAKTHHETSATNFYLIQEPRLSETISTAYGNLVFANGRRIRVKQTLHDVRGYLTRERNEDANKPTRITDQAFEEQKVMGLSHYVSYQSVDLPTLPDLSQTKAEASAGFTWIFQDLNGTVYSRFDNYTVDMN